ncbi:unnamed protein product [Brachionus calyciflorus]|uniref:Uncharacterized protein n=1 Tax=Brachionus calyciflorus TaxID=104777 RepID=A0A814NYQ3_9BILA|nr:unnamed protein product [Brachionus calyciflorus]
MLKILYFLVNIIVLRNSEVAIYGQCGGNNWQGETVCDSSSYCRYINPDYSQCLPKPNDPLKVNEWGKCGGQNYTGNTTCQDWLICVYESEYFSQCLKISSSNYTNPTNKNMSTNRIISTLESLSGSQHTSLKESNSIEILFSTSKLIESTKMIFTIESNSYKQNFTLLTNTNASLQTNMINTTKLTSQIKNISTDMPVSSSYEPEKTTNAFTVTIRNNNLITGLITSKEIVSTTISNYSSFGNFKESISNSLLNTATEINSSFQTKFLEDIFILASAENVVDLIKYQIEINNCLSNCSNHGICVKISESIYGCSCYKNFIGSSCQYNTSLCSSRPCLNNGTCQNLNDSYSCLCNDFYKGRNCELEIDVCLNETCSNKGLCYNFNFEPKCKCFKSYSGDKCQIESNELKVVKVTIKTASIIAIIVIASLFLILILCDITKLFGKGIHIKKKRSVLIEEKIAYKVKI